MNVSFARRIFSRRILSASAGLILIAAPILATAAAADPYHDPDDVAAYQAYTAQYGQPMPPPGRYPAPPNFADRNQLEARLNYAESQYAQARRAGDERAAKHWKKQIKHLSRELSGGGYPHGSGHGASAFMPPGGPSFGPPPSAYAPPMPENAPPGYAQQFYPPTGYPPAGYPAAGYPSNGYPQTGDPNAGYPYGTAASPYGAPGAVGQTGSTGGLGALLGPLMGGGAAPSAAPYGGYPQGANAPSPYGVPGAVGQTGSAGGLGALLGPLMGGGAAPSAAPYGGYPQGANAASPYGAPGAVGQTGSAGGLGALLGPLLGGRSIP